MRLLYTDILNIYLGNCIYKQYRLYVGTNFPKTRKQALYTPTLFLWSEIERMLEMKNWEQLG